MGATAGAEIDSLTYGNTGWPYATGSSMFLCANHLSADDNDLPASWDTDSLHAWGTAGNFGTPGTSNPSFCDPP